MAKLVKRSDGWMNVLTKLGTARDKRFGAEFTRDVVDEYTAEELWLGDPMAARIIELPPKIAYRSGFKVRVSELEARSPRDPYVEEHLDDVGDFDPGAKKKPAEEDVSDELKEAEEGMKAILDDLNVVSMVIQAEQWARAYGGAALLLGLDDGQADLSKPVRVESLKALRYLVLMRPREIWPATWSTNPLSANYGKPVTYNVQRETSGTVPTSMLKVHHTRIIRFEGVRVSKRQANNNHGWGDSILSRMVQTLRDYHSSQATVPVLLQDFAQAVFKMKGFAELLASGDDDVVAKRVSQIDAGRSLLRAIVTDGEDEFMRLQTPVSGLPELVDRAGKNLVAASGMPKSLLFGDDPAGMNATGDANVRWFYDDLQGQREIDGRPKVNRIVKLIFQSSEGPTAGDEPEKWTVSFGPMWLPTAAEVADIRGKVATADKAMVDAGVLTPEEVATSRYGGDEWSIETKLDTAAREAQKAADDAIINDPQMAAAMALGGGSPVPGQPPLPPGQKPPAQLPAGTKPPAARPGKVQPPGAMAKETQTKDPTTK